MSRAGNRQTETAVNGCTTSTNDRVDCGAVPNPVAISNAALLTTANTSTNESEFAELLNSIDDFEQPFTDPSDASFRSRSNTWPLKVPDVGGGWNQRFEPSQQLGARIDEKDELAVVAVGIPDTFDCEPMAGDVFANRPSLNTNGAAQFGVYPASSSGAYSAASFAGLISTNNGASNPPLFDLDSAFEFEEDTKLFPAVNNNCGVALNRNANGASQIFPNTDGLLTLAGVQQPPVAGHPVGSPPSTSPTSSTCGTALSQNSSVRHNDAADTASAATSQRPRARSSLGSSNEPGQSQAQADMLESLLSDDRIAALLSTNLSGTRHKPTRRNAWGNLSYADLITLAIESSPDKRLTLTRIYEWMTQNVPYFMNKADQNSSAGWKNSIRHNLSLHSRFMRVQNETTGKSSWWVINPEVKTQLLAQHELATKHDIHGIEGDHQSAAVVGAASSHRRRAQTMDVSEVEVKRNKLKRTIDARRNGPPQGTALKQPHREPPPPLQSASGSIFGSLSSLSEQQQNDNAAANSNSNCGLPAAVAALQINTPTPSSSTQPFLSAPANYATQPNTSPHTQHSQHTPIGSPSTAYLNSIGSTSLKSVSAGQFATELNPTDLFDSPMASGMYSSPFACESAETSTFTNTQSAGQFVGPTRTQYMSNQSPAQLVTQFSNQPGSGSGSFYNRTTGTTYQSSAQAQFTPTCSCSQLGSASCPVHSQSFTSSDDVYYSNGSMYAAQHTQPISPAAVKQQNGTPLPTASKATSASTPQAAFNNALSLQRSMSMSTGSELRAAQQAALATLRASQQQQQQNSSLGRTFGDLRCTDVSAPHSNDSLTQLGIQRSKETPAAPSASMLRAALLAPPRFTASTKEASNSMLRKYLSQDASSDQRFDGTQANGSGGAYNQTSTHNQPLAEFYVHGDQQGTFYDSPEGPVFTVPDGSHPNFATYVNQTTSNTATYAKRQQPLATAVYTSQQVAPVYPTQGANRCGDAQNWNGQNNIRNSVPQGSTYFSTSPVSPDYLGGPQPFSLVSTQSYASNLQSANDMTADSAYVKM